MIFAVAAIALVACSKEFDTNKSASNGTAIGFNTWAEHLTKATSNTITDAFASGDNFAVYGYKDKTTPAPVPVFNDDVVSTTDGSAWTYAPVRYWDGAYDKYVFFAISPATVGTEADGTNGSTDVNPQTGAFVTRDITFAGDDNDILVADKKEVAKGNSAPYFDNYATVPLVFNHVTSLVDFKVKKTTSLNTVDVKVSAFTLSNIDNKGKLTVTNAYTDNHPVVSWSTDTRAAYLPEDGVTPVYGDVSTSAAIAVGNEKVIAADTAFNPEAPTTPAASTFLINNLVVKPQTFRPSNGENPQQLSISYTLGSDPTVYTRVLYLADFDNADDAAQDDTKIASWEPGKHYTFFITIDAKQISFSASITEWTDVNGYNYILN